MGNTARVIDKPSPITKNRILLFDNFHRFLGSSLSLNRILKKTQQIDGLLAEQIDELEFYISDQKRVKAQDAENWSYFNKLDLVSMLRESFLMTGKMVGNIHSRITPETEQVLIIEVEKELDILLLHLENVDIKTPKLTAQQQKMKQTLHKYNAALRRIKANLKQRWLVMDALVTSQNELLSMVELTESKSANGCFGPSRKFEKGIGRSRLNAILISVFAFLLFLIFTS
eukprot:TRINITY_DN9656_c0_g1_i1.p1 TRINITY_DN9656_c0_g1~~TRINITY_DN9656_c0_g1_i1.p1  ORF type:complete len:248 (+),score=68.25 TRINITY_DN9656_c0_g1_i1:60-746(+)